MIEMGQAVAEQGVRCRGGCEESHRPVWLDGDVVCCATCAARRHPSESIRFLGGIPSQAGRLDSTANEETDNVKIGQPASSMEIWDEGTYPAKVAEMTPESAEGSKYGKARLKWVIRARNADGETSDIWYWTNQTLSTNKLATFRPLVKAVLPGADLDDPNLEIDTDELIGKPCRVQLGIDEERGKNVIEKILPAQPRTQNAAAREPVRAGAVPTVAERKAAAAVADPRVDEEDAPPF